MDPTHLTLRSKAFNLQCCITDYESQFFFFLLYDLIAKLHIQLTLASNSFVLGAIKPPLPVGSSDSNGAQCKAI